MQGSLLKFILAAVLLFFSDFILAQNSCSTRYKERTFNSIQIFRDVVYTKNSPALLTVSPGVETTFNKDLKMDIFMPPPTDTVSARPLIILAHGGGFINVLFMGGTVLVGTKDNDDVQALADTLAHWGYVTASIEYRTGFDILSTSSIKRAVWRGAQDMSAAIRFFRKNAQWFDIDPNRLFIGGSSAGAFCALHSAFVDDNERIPESFQLIPFLIRDLGKLHSRPVVELTGFNPFTGNNVLGDDVDSLPIGIASYWGAIADLNMLSGNNSAPMIMFHGMSDIIVSPECAQPFSSVILVAPVTCGTIEMDSVLTDLNITHETHLAAGESHEYWGALNGDWLPTGPDAYWLPIIQGTADFFYEIMQPAAPTVNGPASVLPNSINTYSVANPVAGSVYCWEIDGGTIVSANPTASTVDVLFYSSSSSGLVKCAAIDAADVSSQQQSKAVSVANPSSVPNIYQNEIVISPNPTAGNIQINFEQTPNAAIIQLYSIEGQLLSSFQTQQQRNALDLTEYASGLYFLVIQEQGKVAQNFKVSKL